MLEDMGGFVEKGEPQLIVGFVTQAKMRNFYESTLSQF